MSVTQHDAMERSIIRKADAAQSETPPRECKMTSDESLKRELEVNADAIVDRYCHECPVALPSDIIVHEEIKTFASRYSRLAFDDSSMDYSRADLLSGEVNEPPFCGFYRIGCDGGEVSYYVRKGGDDGRIYAFDTIDSARPEPYANNIRCFVIMRYAAWLQVNELLAEKSRTGLINKACGLIFSSLGGIVVLGFDAIPLYVSTSLLYDCVLGPAEYTNVRLIIVCAVFFVTSLLIAIFAVRNIVKGLSTTLRDYGASRR